MVSSAATRFYSSDSMVQKSLLCRMPPMPRYTPLPGWCCWCWVLPPPTPAANMRGVEMFSANL